MSLLFKTSDYISGKIDKFFDCVDEGSLIFKDGVNNYLTRIFDTTFQGASYKINESLIDRMTYYLKGIWSLEPIYFILFIPAIFLLFKKKKKIFLFLFSFIFIYFLFLSPLTGTMQRYSLPILPFLIIMVAYFINWINNCWLNKNYLKEKQNETILS